MAEEFIYYAAPAGGLCQGWQRKWPERQPHQAPEQGEDDARARRKTGSRGGQRRDGEGGRQATALGRGGDAGRRAPGRCGERQGGATEYGRGAVVIFLRNCMTGEPSGEASDELIG
jgi:hypothetical protein